MIKLTLEDPIYLSKVIVSNADRLGILADFLISESYSFGYCNWYKSWLKEGGEFVLGKVYELNAVGAEKILVNEQEFLSGNENPTENDPFVFVTTRRQLIDILDRWINIISYRPQPKEIDIIQENDGSIIFKAFNAAGEEIKVERKLTVKGKIIDFLHRLKKRACK